MEGKKEEGEKEGRKGRWRKEEKEGRKKEREKAMCQLCNYFIAGPSVCF